MIVKNFMEQSVTPMSRPDCEHGHLARSCDICELDDLRAENEWARALLTPVAGPWTGRYGAAHRYELSLREASGFKAVAGVVDAGEYAWIVDVKGGPGAPGAKVASVEEARAAADAALRAAGWFLRESEDS